MASDFPFAVTAELTVLAETPSRFHVTLVSLDAGRMVLSEAPFLTPGSPVKVCQQDRLWLGEVAKSESGGRVTIDIVHSLNRLQELSRLADRFLQDKPQQDKPQQDKLPQGREQPEPALATSPTLS